MTQRFRDDGHVERVTVLEAGPCPVTAHPHRTSATATRPSSSASAPCARRRSPRPSSATSRRPTRRRCARCGVPRRGGRAEVGDTVTVDAFEIGQTVKVAGISQGQGLPGHDQAPQLRRRPEVPRLAQRARPGLDRRLGDARRACSRASAAPAAWAASASTQRGPDDRRADPRPEPAARPRLGARARRAAPWRCAPMADAPILGGDRQGRRSTPTSSATPFNGPLVHESSCAELAARRRGTHATKTRGEVRGGGAKPWRQKGTGRARAGSSRSPIWTGGGIVFGPQPRHYTVKVNRKARRARAARRAVGARRARLARRASTRRRSTRRRPSRRPSCSDAHRGGSRAGRARRDEESAAASRSATSRACTCCRPTTSASPTSSAPRRSCVSRGRARRADRARARSPRARPRRRRLMDPQPGDHPAGRLREVLRAGDGQQVHVPRPPGRAQDADPPGRRGALRRDRARACAPSTSAPSPSAAASPPAARASGRRRSCRSRGATDPALRGPRGRL